VLALNRGIEGIASMKVRQGLIGCFILIVASVLLSASVAHHPPQTQEPRTPAGVALTVDPDKSTLHYTVGSSLHTIHGTFALKSGSLQLITATGQAAGEIVADATSGASGNASRDKKMNIEVLDSSRYAEIVFWPDHIEGNLPMQGTATVRVHGKLALHGSQHDLVVPVRAELQANEWKGQAHFTVPYVEWGLKNPSNFLLKVNRAVEIDLQMTGSVETTQTAAAQR
jgi:polyisoprenoid-binding protein YceI